jgi:hypothetical protein
MIGHTGGLCAALSGLVMYCVAIITQGVALGSYVSRRWRSRLPEQLLKGHNQAPTTTAVCDIIYIEINKITYFNWKCSPDSSLRSV